MNWWLGSAAILVLGLGLFHSILGERYLVRRLLRRDNLPTLFGGDAFTKSTIRYAWHLLTILAVAVAGILFWTAGTSIHEEHQPSLAIIFGALTLCGFWGIAATGGRHLSWIVFFVAAFLVFVGADFGIQGK